MEVCSFWSRVIESSPRVDDSSGRGRGSSSSRIDSRRGGLRLQVESRRIQGKSRRLFVKSDERFIGSDERFIGAPSVVGWNQPPMNCVIERALAASHVVSGHYGDFSVMRKR
jgi:hypothetical protein